MNRVQGHAEVRLLECTNPARGKWRVRWDVQPGDDGSATYMEEEFDHRPTEEEIRSLVMAWHNARTAEVILSGFTWRGTLVWLSQENQLNYKAAYDLAVQTAGASLPATFKFGTDDMPVYHTFDTVEELADFYTKAMTHIQATLAEGWKRKDAFSLEEYRI